MTNGGERIAKQIARAGLCSRREAERWVAQGRVKVNGKTISTPALNIGDGDIVLVDGRPLPQASAARLWRYNKPRGLVTTTSDPEGRRTVFDALPNDLPRVMSVGRLDLNSEGLLLLTNDGALARLLELPRRGWVRRYRVRVFGGPSAKTLAELRRGIEIDGQRYLPIDVEIERQSGANCWLKVGLREGKNREIRKLFEHFNHPVSRLIRTAFGPFQLGNLTRGEVSEIPSRVVRDQLGAEAKGILNANRRR